MGLLFLLRCALEPKNELNNFQFFDLKMTRQSLKLEKFMPDQVEITFDHVRWPKVISTPGGCTLWTRQWNLVSNTRNVFLEKFTKTWWRNYSQTILLKIIIERISESTVCNIIICVFIVCPSRGLPKYIKAKVLTTFFYLIESFLNGTSFSTTFRV